MKRACETTLFFDLSMIVLIDRHRVKIELCIVNIVETVVVVVVTVWEYFKICLSKMKNKFCTHTVLGWRENVNHV